MTGQRVARPRRLVAEDQGSGHPSAARLHGASAESREAADGGHEGPGKVAWDFFRDGHSLRTFWDINDGYNWDVMINWDIWKNILKINWIFHWDIFMIEYPHYDGTFSSIGLSGIDSNWDNTRIILGYQLY